MFISAVSNQNFKGLWGKVNINKNYTAITYNYYPFKGESQREINRNKNRYTDRIQTVDDDGKTKCISSMVKIHSELPFSKQTFKEYLKGKCNFENITLIDGTVRKFALQYFLNKNKREIC